jgi:phage-related protein
MPILSLPDSAKITKRQRCAVKTLDASSYTLRSGHAPLAEITVELEILEQAEIDALIAQLEAARGIDFFELPYLSAGEHFLVQEYKTAPLLQGVYSSLSLTMIQQRSGVVPEDSSLFRCPHVPLYDSGRTSAFRNIAQQFKGGYQATKAKGDKSTEQYWDVVFHLSPAEAEVLDGQLVARRGIYSFNWSPIGDQLNEDTWLCAEWQIEYFVYGLYIFSGKFLKTGTAVVATPTINCTQLTYQNPDDNKGVFYFIGSSYLNSGWVLPTTKGVKLLCDNLLTSDAFGNYPLNQVTNLVDRSSTPPFWANGATPNGWVAIDLGLNTDLQLGSYYLKARSDTSNTMPRSWRLQGTNDVSSWDVNGVTSANWVDIDAQSNNAALTGQSSSVNINTDTGRYRYFRLQQTGVNSDFGSYAHSINYFVLGEIELYGNLCYPGTTIAPEPCDPFWNNVLALLPLKNNFNEIRHNLSTFNLLPSITTDLDPFGNPGVAKFDGNQGFNLASSTLELSGDFTIETWFKPTSILVSSGSQPGYYYSTILELRVDSQYPQPFNVYFNDTLAIGVGWVNNIPNTFSNPGKVLMNSDNYLNVSRQGTNFRLFLNGEILITIPNVSGNLSSNLVDWYIGGFKPSPPFGFKGLVGFMSNLRVSSIYRDGSIVPTTKFPTIGCSLQS